MYLHNTYPSNIEIGMYISQYFLIFQCFILYGAHTEIVLSTILLFVLSWLVIV